MRPEPSELQELVHDLHRQATPWLPAGLCSFAVITRAAGADMAPVHDRQPVILTPAEGLDWLDRGDLEALPAPGPKGSLILREVPRPASGPS